MPGARLMDPNTALYDIGCSEQTCEDWQPAEGGNNLTRTQALRHLRRHRKQFPTHCLHWCALGSFVPERDER